MCYNLARAAGTRVGVVDSFAVSVPRRPREAVVVGGRHVTLTSTFARFEFFNPPLGGDELRIAHETNLN